MRPSHSTFLRCRRLRVVFGGSYGSGQEVAQFVSSAGPDGGYVALAVVALIWGLLLGTSFELARRHRAFEYSGFMAVLLRRGAFIYEIAILLAMVLILGGHIAGALKHHFVARDNTLTRMISGR